MPCNHCKIVLCAFARFCVIHFIFGISFVYISDSRVRPRVYLFVFDILKLASFIKF
jgi:hypothetical protein